MTPLKRVLVAIGVLLILMLSALLVSWHLQERALAEALVNDVAATLSRPINWNSKPESAKHENGFACLAAAMTAIPSDLGPLDLKDQHTVTEILDAGVVPEAVGVQFAALEPWTSSVRACGDSAGVAFVPGVTPFEPLDLSKGRPRSGVITALTRMTRVQARLLSAEQSWVDVAERCAGALEVAFDYGHVNLVGAMIASNAAQQLTPACSEALQRLPPDSRARLAERFARLRSRQVTNTELMETERLNVSLSTYRSFLDDEQQAKVPPGEDWLIGITDPFARISAPRLWGRWDRAMRQLVVAAREGGPARAEASRNLDEAFASWWVPSLFNMHPSYEKFLLRNDETAALARMWAELAAGTEVTIAPPLAKTSQGIEFTRAGTGDKVVIPLVH